MDVRKGVLLAVLLAGVAWTPLASAQVDIGSFIKKDAFADIKISPDGRYFAATVPLEDKTGLVVLQRADLKVTARFALGRNTHIDGFTWVNNERLILSMSQKFGALDMPRPTGELYGMDADGGNRKILVGQRAQQMQAGTRLQTSKDQRVAAYLVDSLPDVEHEVLISTSPFLDDPHTRVERMDVRNGRRVQVTRAPVRRASFVTDNTGSVRFAYGAGTDNNNQLYYRAGDEAQWELINDEVGNGGIEFPLGFAADNKTAYLQSDKGGGADAILAFDVASRTRKELARHEAVDPHRIIRTLGSGVPVGATYMLGKPTSVFFDDAGAEARLYRSLEAAFPDDAVHITSTTADGRLALVQASSDRNPGDFFIFDTVSKKASHLLSRRDWFDPAQMARMQPIELKARDGLVLRGYVTTPAGSTGKGLPTVVMPHGGPFGILDTWGFDDSAQMLAQAGYAVLQVNYRGSGGYGRGFEQAGAREWGAAMQDDLTDATRWAIQQGISDPGKICMYGASYGAYASLMGVAREPTLYRCAAGYIGVYDLPMMHTAGDIQERMSGATYLAEWVGPRDTLAKVSPTNLAASIKVPVFIAAGGEDERAPIAHSKLMEARLKSAGVPVETLYYATEGHGFYTEPNRREYYTRLLDFLSRHIGGAKAN